MTDDIAKDNVTASASAEDRTSVSFVDEENLAGGTSTGSANGASAKRGSLGLSMISRMYDREGKGELDPVEQALRDLDQSGRGDLANEKAYIIMEDLHKQQKKNVTLTKLLWALGAFAVIMSLAVLGLSFAAASLAKDTSVDKASSNMMTKEGDNIVGTKPVAGVQLTLGEVTDENGSTRSCINVVALSEAYKEVKDGSTSISIVTRTGTDDDGSALTEKVRTLSEVSKDGDIICLGDPSDKNCFNLGNPCGSTPGDEEDGGKRRLEKARKLKDTFRQIMEGENPALRERLLPPGCPGNCGTSCNGNCGNCDGCVSSDPVPTPTPTPDCDCEPDYNSCDCTGYTTCKGQKKCNLDGECVSPPGDNVKIGLMACPRCGCEGDPDPDCSTCSSQSSCGYCTFDERLCNVRDSNYVCPVVL